PALVELVQGRQAALDVSFYERTIGPLALATILLVGICPWLAWGGVSSEKLRRKLLPSALVALVAAISLVVLGIREPLVLLAGFIGAFVGISLLTTLCQGTLARRRGSGEGIPRAFLRSVSSNRRRYGAHIVHLGIVLMAVGVTGSTVYQDEVQVALAPGESTDVHGYTLEYQDLVSEELPGQESYTAFVDVHRGDRQLEMLRPKQDYYWNIEQWVTEVAIRSTLKEDLYVILAGFDESGLATFRVLVNPLVVWLWVGGVALLLGGIMAWWPAASERNVK
ncbi:MAG: heme lyase CcmF/NrfE family subunit, partial [Anaerolineae bacterium]|nr:heme lyase CcmF/NrfE family subunit [Anaerolineae bacterium]